MFCIVKAAVLHGKSVGFALQKSRFRNAKSKLPFSFGIIFTNQDRNNTLQLRIYAVTKQCEIAFQWVVGKNFQ
ncbi:hypothetical protein CTM62_07135 [Prevotella intermedia]|uniref:Uncharacterized protein n=1 Tax=Prevotella intermedia TaxID=28131 RepID=A0A2D3L7V1_PREIN|nr:hypothetical protein CTM62_07135 [Prevotella intermedia]